MGGSSFMELAWICSVVIETSHKPLSLARCLASGTWDTGTQDCTCYNPQDIFWYFETKSYSSKGQKPQNLQFAGERQADKTKGISSLLGSCHKRREWVIAFVSKGVILSFKLNLQLNILLAWPLLSATPNVQLFTDLLLGTTYNLKRKQHKENRAGRSEECARKHQHLWYTAWTSV